jgi:hypothetical protein
MLHLRGRCQPVLFLVRFSEQGFFPSQQWAMALIGSFDAIVGCPPNEFCVACVGLHSYGWAFDASNDCRRGVMSNP